MEGLGGRGTDESKPGYNTLEFGYSGQVERHDSKSGFKD